MKYIKQIAIILGICLLAELLEYLIPLPIAASIYGLVLMLAALITGIVPLKEVEGAADFLTENMTIMFIPSTVGIMACVDEMQKMLVPLVVISVVSTFLIMAVTGWAAQAIMHHKNSRTAEKCAPGKDCQTAEKRESEKKDRTAEKWEPEKKERTAGKREPGKERSVRQR